MCMGDHDSERSTKDEAATVMIMRTKKCDEWATTVIRETVACNFVYSLFDK